MASRVKTRQEAIISGATVVGLFRETLADHKKDTKISCDCHMDIGWCLPTVTNSCFVWQLDLAWPDPRFHEDAQLFLKYNDP